jgi:hypothetical protein
MAITRARPMAGSKRKPVDSRDKNLLLRMFQTRVLMRAIKDRMVSMYRAGDLLESLYTGHWHEAIAVGTAGRGGRARRPAGPGTGRRRRPGASRLDRSQ